MSSYRYYKMARQLAELTDLGVELARDLKRKAEYAETTKAKADLAGAFAAVAEEVSRSVALEARLLREAREAGLSAGRPRPPARREAAAAAAEPVAADPLAPKIIKH